jgi:hypothetical protein
MSTNITQKISEKYKLDNLSSDLKDLRVTDIVSAILVNDIASQIALLQKIGSSFELGKILSFIFDNNKNLIINYIVNLDNINILKTYYSLLKIEDLDKNIQSNLLNLALDNASLNILTALIDLCKVIPDQTLITKYFDKLAQVRDFEKIQKFIKSIKSVKLLEVFLQQRDKLTEHLGNSDLILKSFMHYVGIYCNIEWLNVLLNAGEVLPQLWDFDKNTPIHMAVITEKYQKLEDKIEFTTLIIQKCNIASLYRNRDNKTAYDLAIEQLNKYKDLLVKEKAKQKISLINQAELQKQVDCYTKLVDMLSKIYRD